MTKEEHAVLIAMFAKQMQTSKIILQILRSRELVTPDDERAFESIVNQDAQGTADLMRDAISLYLQIATKMGVDTGLSGPPPIQTKPHSS